MGVIRRERLAGLQQWPYWTLLKWSIMSAAIFWTLIYQLAGQASRLPEFVYVNF